MTADQSVEESKTAEEGKEERPSVQKRRNSFFGKGNNLPVPYGKYNSGDESESSSADDETNGERENAESSIASSKGLQGIFKSTSSKAIIYLGFVFVIIEFSTIAYVILANGENDSYEDQFTTLSNFLIDGANERVEYFSRGIESLAVDVAAFTSYEEKQWPLIDVPDFARRTYEPLKRSNAELIAFIPTVSKEEEEFFVNFAKNNLDWVKEDYDFYQTTGDPVTATDLPDSLQDPAGGGVSDYYLPLWQMSPVTSNVTRSILYDVGQTDVLQSCVNLTAPRLGENGCLTGICFGDEAVVSYAGRDHHSDPTRIPDSHIMQPVFDSLDDATAAVRGYLMAIVPWDTYFTELIPQGRNGFVVVVRDNCVSSPTLFSLRVDGPNVTYLGRGDLHNDEDEFEDLARVSKFASFSTNEFCTYTITVYPTETLRASYLSTEPVIYSVYLALLFVVTALVFLAYDIAIRWFIYSVKKTAKTTEMIVASLFPDVVKDRMMQAHDEEKKEGREVQKKDGEVTRRDRLGSMDFSAPVGPAQRLRQYLSSDQYSQDDNASVASDDVSHVSGGGGSVASGARSHVSGVSSVRNKRPIADLFPKCTVMFADLVGFTAWSSAREPSQVFTLLETIYNAFDKLARRRRVFKVETIGDCYVAVAGLPEPRNDHAVIMCKFARDCLMKLSSLTRQLEVSLGPDTGDLKVRIGLHSGPVTAGVLRGEKSRFQLFGDTVNTTARMETNGKPGRIHISEETAEELKKHEKSDWFVKREEKIIAKGKGELQTYWIEINRMKRNTFGGASVCSSSSQFTGDLASVVQDTEEAHGVEVQTEEEKKILEGSAEFNIPVTVTTVPNKQSRLVRWVSDALAKLLTDIVVHRKAMEVEPTEFDEDDVLDELKKEKGGYLVIHEFENIIHMPQFSSSVARRKKEIVLTDPVTLSKKVTGQLYDYVQAIATMYMSHPFHDFEHACHVIMSVTKLLARIVAPDLDYGGDGVDGETTKASATEKTLHDYTFGITSDPFTQFAVAFGALIHDVDHPGVPNAQLVKEKTELAFAYQDTSIAEQNSVDTAWSLLMDRSFRELRRTIFATEAEFRRFRQLVVNTVMATDVMDKNLNALRKDRWNKAFAEGYEHKDDSELLTNCKATIVIEHLIQASDVAHTMQHWHVYRKWNERLFHEVYRAFKDGRAEKDPSTVWYAGELGFFDHYVIPLAKKLKDCGVFGVSSDDYLNYAQKNRNEWEEKGKEVVAEMMEAVHQKYG